MRSSRSLLSDSMTSLLRNGGLLVATLMCVGTATAADAELDQLLGDAVANGAPIESILHGQRVRAVSMGRSGVCDSVGLVYPDMKGRGGARIVNYRICDGMSENTQDVSPALPNDRQMQEVVRMSMMGALTSGSHAATYQAYRITSRRNSPLDASGCAMVETTVSSMGLLVSQAGGRICSK